MGKSPWIILIMGVIGCVALVIMSQVYLQKTPAVQIHNGLRDEMQINDAAALISPEGDGYTVTYSLNPAVCASAKLIDRNMTDVAEYIRSRYAVTRVRVSAKAPDGTVHKLLYPPDPPPPPSPPKPPSSPNPAS